MGEKRVLGDAGCMLPLILGGPQCFSLAFHSVVTLRMSWYAPPDTVGIKFAASCHRISAINGRCGPDSLVCTFLRGSLLCLPRPYNLPRKKVTPIKISAAPSIDGSCSKATSCKSAATSQSAALTAPLEGEPRGARLHAFPYEGKVARRKP